MTQIRDSVLFDLDGTLWDATGVTADAWVRVLAAHPGLSPAVPMTVENVRKYMGLTNEELAEIFFPDLAFDDAFALMMESCDWENRLLPECGGILYDGVEETLRALHGRGVRLFIVSNCQDGYIEAFIRAHRMDGVIMDWECTGRTGKCKADNIRDVIRRNSLHDPVYVGDTVSDKTGADGAGIPLIYAKYGFGESEGRGRVTEYDDSVDSIRELLSRCIR
ncbi:MAG: HAD family hydrolase [Clostridia bacterium]|nr:HAD family hydrolase [Clostridia bacterium]MBQ8511613.1 HAD family hydrolase [Clostridia bacterium]